MNRHLADTAAPGGHRYLVRVYLEDTDAGGIAYHASYLRFAERGRTEALRDLGLPHAEMVRLHGAMFVVRRLKIDYLRPARFDDLLTVITTPLQVKAASVLVAQSVEGSGGELLVDMELLLACARVSDGRAVRLPAAWHEALIAMHAQGAGADSPAGDTDAARRAASQDAPSGARRD
jgi:acyl-CoA thioester hydrolase